MKKKLLLALTASAILGLVSCGGGKVTPAATSSQEASSSATSQATSEATSEEPVVTSEEPVVTSEEESETHETGLSTEESEQESETHETGLSVSESEQESETHETGLSISESEEESETHETGLSTEESEDESETHETGLSVSESEEESETHETGLSVSETEEEIDINFLDIELSIEGNLHVGDVAKIFVEVNPENATEGYHYEIPNTTVFEIDEEQETLTAKAVGSEVLKVVADNHPEKFANYTVTVVEEEVTITPVKTLRETESGVDFVTRAFYVGGQDKVTQYTPSGGDPIDEYRLLSFADGEDVISIYAPYVSKIEGDLVVGKLYQIKGYTSHVENPGNYKSIQAKLGNEGYIKALDVEEHPELDDDVTAPRYTVYNDLFHPAFEGKDVDKLVHFEKAYVSAASVNKSGTLSATLRLGDAKAGKEVTKFAVYINGKYQDNTAWADVKEGWVVSFDSVISYNDYNGSISYQLIWVNALEAKEGEIIPDPVEPQPEVFTDLSAIDISEVENQKFTEDTYMAKGQVVANGENGFWIDDGTGVAVVYTKAKSTYKIGDVVKVVGPVQNYYKEKEFAADTNTQRNLEHELLEDVEIESLYLDTAVEYKDEALAALMGNHDSRASLPVIISGEAISATELSVAGEKVVLKDRLGFEDLEVGVKYTVKGYLAGYNGSKKYFNIAVNTLEAVHVDVTEFKLNNTSLELEINQRAQLRVEVNEGASSAASWRIEEGGEEVVSVDEDGVVTALKAGEATVTAICAENPEFTASCVITVKEASHELTSVAKTMEEIKNENNWTVSTNGKEVCYKDFDLDSVIHVSTSGEPNCGSYWEPSAGKDWRLYQAKGGDVTIAAADGYVIESVTFSFTTTNDGVLLDSLGTAVTKDEPHAVKAESERFVVGNSGTKTNGQVRITAISVSYYAK
ncbi:MAG: Ig-like domain-containing protein [Bacilli bacterium]|nr:Ig-like domain-containing protein [Bacilli bacterium]MDY6430633.1 Ig-like domain-containing protein [Bacilli bacterium]